MIKSSSESEKYLGDYPRCLFDVTEAVFYAEATKTLKAKYEKLKKRGDYVCNAYFKEEGDVIVR